MRRRHPQLQALLHAIRNRLSVWESIDLPFRGCLLALVSSDREAIIFLDGVPYTVESIEDELDRIAAGVRWPSVAVIFVFEGRAPIGVARKYPKIYAARTLYAGTLNLTHRILKIHKDAPVPDGILTGL